MACARPASALDALPVAKDVAVPSSHERKPNAMVVLYRWRLHPGHEAAFIQGWSRLTELLLERGSFGSRLHRGGDGLWYAYAQWPSDQIRQAAFALGPLDEAATAQIKSAIAERFPEVVLDPIADYLVPLARDRG